MRAFQKMVVDIARSGVFPRELIEWLGYRMCVMRTWVVVFHHEGVFVDMAGRSHEMFFDDDEMIRIDAILLEESVKQVEEKGKVVSI